MIRQGRALSRPVHSASGFTLVEMVMVIVLLGILAAVGAPMLANGLQVATTASSHFTTLSQARYATERLARELREVSVVGGAYSFTSLASSTSLTFTKSNGTQVTISYASPNLNISYGGTTRSLSTQASGFSLAYRDIDGVATTDTSAVRFVDVLLTVQIPSPATQTYTQRVRVALRNTA